MKNRYSTYDVICIVSELKQYEGMRVHQIYDINNKTYLIKLQNGEQKVVLQMESGSRVNSTEFDWPKNAAPSGFSMKLRKHLKNKRLELIEQLGLDRIIHFQFGSSHAANHVFLELFDKGNIVLTDHELNILYLLRFQANEERHKLALNQKYPIDKARLKKEPSSEEEVKQTLLAAKSGDNLKKVISTHLDYGPALADHVLLGVGFSGGAKIGHDVDVTRDLHKIMNALQEADEIILKVLKEPSKGYIIQKVDTKPHIDGTKEEFRVNVEFHPMLFRQHENKPFTEFPSFDKAVDAFFSTLEGQLIDMKIVQQEKDALKKLENVRRDHNQRMEMLENTKETDRIKAEIILSNRELVDEAILAIRSALANQMAWSDIKTMVKDSADAGEPIAKAIKELKLDTNHIVLQLVDPYNEDDEDGGRKKENEKPITVNIDLDLTAFANARKYFDQKRTASKKQQKTLESQNKALKSAEKKTVKSLQEIKIISNITKARKVFWFEKFFWFISSENYLIIAGRDMKQNELIVKRYMAPEDIYVHADIHGASSIVIKNPTKEEVPPKTLNEAGIMAVCYSIAWDAKVITTAWWVHSSQVSLSAESGEYLATGSFVIRGKKNFLPPTNLILGFTFMFKLEESSVFRHAEERKIRDLDETSSIFTESIADNEVEIILTDDENEKEDTDIPETVDELESNEIFEPIEEEEEKDSQSEEELSENKEEENLAKEVVEVEDLFPDTEIKIHHKGKDMVIETKPLMANTKYQIDEDEEEFVFLGDDKPVAVPRRRQNKQNCDNKGVKKVPKNENKPPKTEVTFEGDKPAEPTKLKRGQKSKLKKIKEKYKDQDEEDRQMRAALLQQLQESTGPKKMKKKEKKKAEMEKQLQRQQQRQQRQQQQNANKLNSGNQSGPRVASDGEEGEEEHTEPTVNTDLTILSSLTGIPQPEDELLFAVPVVAPYSTIQNYKFKVKVTPGTGKRGKAVRTALAIFLKDKLITKREKDLLKSVKDAELPRNLPGKVKLSAPQTKKK